MNNKELKASVGALNPCVSKETTSALAEVKHCACYELSILDRASGVTHIWDVVWLSKTWIPEEHLVSTGEYSIENLKFMPVEFGLNIIKSLIDNNEEISTTPDSVYARYNHHTEY